ncbi:hypothetical protein HMPREF9123_1782 [Neisseria bacilliformis ATCC BAA-1200]|uniref:Uncharacterized protein n=1 Tax=Neisseria bacilliformis ATCC BAA-1200 TaxID=888742 RepID=F2BDH6_9NEIS|nr:hypothetical protein HMPREF9123_1782 [Neisseria bacilliformis ATCC BAA-1200]
MTRLYNGNPRAGQGKGRLKTRKTGFQTAFLFPKNIQTSVANPKTACVALGRHTLL